MPISRFSVLKISLLLTLLVSGTLVGCDPLGSLADWFGTITAGDSTFQSPLVFNSPVQGGPPDESRLEAVTAQLTPRNGGAVVGQLIDVHTFQPLADIPVYLAKLEGTDDFPVAELNRQEDPRAFTDENGIFQFNGIEPGQYVIIAGAEGSGGMISDGSTGLTLLLDVKQRTVASAGQVLIEAP